MCTESDVLVIGGGIAGITAAIEAARAGAATTIACAGPLFGGSSFYPGTWGLGLIGPESEADEADLIATIEDVGCSMADHELVEVFVRGIRPAIAWLEEDLGVPLKRPSSAQSASDKTFIPCFDHKRRLWRGITRQTFEAAAQRTLKTLDVNVFERTELMELARLHEDDGAVCGAVFFDHASASLRTSAASSVILAAGGTGGLFERSLTSADVLSSVHAIAMSAGCELVNIEFMQMMPGLVSPVRGIVFNEKTFRYAIPEDASGILPHSEDARADLLEARSSHGPFTCRLDDERVDRAIDAAGPSGMPVRFRFPSNNIPEFVQTFSTWMQQSLNIAPTDELRIAMYAHAANGGIRIDRNAWTGVKGLYACGELTGGMHGADRIGGLSSANGLVFGRIAGKAAARHAKQVSCADQPLNHGCTWGGTSSRRDDAEASHARLDDVGASACISLQRKDAAMPQTRMDEAGTSARAVERPLNASCEEALGAALNGLRMSAAPLSAADADRITRDMRHVMGQHAMITRTEDGLSEALADIECLQREVGYHQACRGCVIPSDSSIARGVRVASQLALAHAMLRAMLNRRESIGSHLRIDTFKD
ncbi:MAG: FAD-binding protein [Collinsella stercoris]|nr:FAD-binding protein [Collinsella stercoris]